MRNNTTTFWTVPHWMDGNTWSKMANYSAYCEDRDRERCLAGKHETDYCHFNPKEKKNCRRYKVMFEEISPKKRMPKPTDGHGEDE